MEKSAIHQLPGVEPMRRNVSDRAAWIAATIAITRISLPLLGVQLHGKRGVEECEIDQLSGVEPLGRSAGGNDSCQRQQGRP